MATNDERTSQEIINSLEQEMRNKLSTLPKDLETLKEWVVKYEGIVNDLLSAKAQYLIIVKKYSDELKPQVNPVLFTGLITPTPMYSSSEMKMDSAQLIDLGEVVEDLEKQKAMAYSQIRYLVNDAVKSITRATTAADEIDTFYSEAVQLSGGGVYGSTSMLNATKPV